MGRILQWSWRGHQGYPIRSDWLSAKESWDRSWKNILKLIRRRRAKTYLNDKVADWKSQNWWLIRKTSKVEDPSRGGYQKEYEDP